MLAGYVENPVQVCALDHLYRGIELLGLGRAAHVTRVSIRSAGCFDCERFILSMAAFSGAVGSILAGFLNPMWLSLICTKPREPGRPDDEYLRPPH